MLHLGVEMIEQVFEVSCRCEKDGRIGFFIVSP